MKIKYVTKLLLLLLLLFLLFSVFIYLQPCPIVRDSVTTPPIDRYIVNIIYVEYGEINNNTCNYTSMEVDEDTTYEVEVFASNIIGNSTKRKGEFHFVN